MQNSLDSIAFYAMFYEQYWRCRVSSTSEAGFGEKSLSHSTAILDLQSMLSTRKFCTCTRESVRHTFGKYTLWAKHRIQVLVAKRQRETRFGECIIRRQRRSIAHAGKNKHQLLNQSNTCTSAFKEYKLICLQRTKPFQYQDLDAGGLDIDIPTAQFQ